MTPIKISSFAKDGQGGNPAGVVIGDTLPSPEQMQTIAADLGYCETAFAARQGADWRVRYHAPLCEVHVAPMNQPIKDVRYAQTNNGIPLLNLLWLGKACVHATEFSER